MASSDSSNPAPEHDAPNQAPAYLAAIVESSHDAIIAKDLDGIIRASNPATERLFGHSPAELIGRSIRILIPPDREREEDEILERIRRGERVDDFETVRLAKSGRPIDISLTVSPVRDASGSIIGVSKIARDITERKRAAAALAAQEQWFRVTLGSIGDAIIASDSDGCVTYLNGVAETLTGWTAADAKGQPLSDVFHIINETSRQQVENPVRVVIRSGLIVGLANHTVLISRDGTERPIADSAATFTVAIPLAAPPSLRAEALAPTHGDANIEEISLANVRVLVVEDDHDAGEFVRNLLTMYGAEVLMAASAHEALERLADARPDILISDIGLPEMDGYQLMERIRDKPLAEGGGIPAVALTAFARSEDRTRALRAGYQAHVAKPVESTELVATVASFAELVSARRTREES